MASTSPQPALATTKRKFHKLLDNLTATASTPSLASTLQERNTSVDSLPPPGTPEPPNKRPRSSNLGDGQRNLSAGQERIRQLKEQLLTPRREGTVRVVGSKPAASPSTPRKVPNFQPYNQEQFLSRLQSFADVKRWSTKPDAISEVEWAKRGWTCDAWNTVACRGGCEQRVVIKLRPKRTDANGKEIEMSEDLAVDIEDELVEKFKDLIVNAHSEDCLWRKRGCQDDIYHIPIASRAKSAAELLTRYNSFKPIADSLPLLEHITYPPPTIETILSRLPPTYFNAPGAPVPSSPPTSPSDTVAFAFALFGWSGATESRIALATCGHCFQRLGLWLSSAARLEEMSQKLSVPIASLRLDLVESHREHCPWKNAAVQGNPPDGPIANMPAWQTLEFMLLGPQKDSPEKRSRHTRAMESVDLGSESGMTYPRGSMESVEREDGRDDEGGNLQEKWKRLKAKLKRTASKKSLRSVKSAKSEKSVALGGKGKGKEKS